WPSIGQAYTGSSTTNDGSQPEFTANSGGNGGNNGNRNRSVYGDSDFNTGFKDKEGTSSSLKVDIPKMNGNNYNEWAQTVRL
ncbi:hypothetical protein A2U01_0078204, partial [Trifolium medium]|nr:hypothetical protein [Trifolium medium]